MNKDYLYTSDEIKKTYEQVHDLLLTRYIIKTYSTNKADIRDIALNGLNLGHVKKVLELGCGYGFFIEKLKGKLHDGAIIIGIDMVENNREPFIHSVESIQYKGEFITGSAEIIRKMTKASFDMIITSYSLYFFPYLMSEIAATLAPGGVFIAITHSKNTLREILQFFNTCMVKTGNRQNGKWSITRLFEAFSLEEGKGQLDKYFNRVEQLNYRNSIVIPHPNINDCVFYIQKKKNLIYKEVLDMGPERLEDVERCVEMSIEYYAREHGSITLNKDDAIFRCFEPKNRI